ncbi:hypothetical protein TM48_01235 [Mycobacterium shottsii]|uniref:YbjN domain-containing protein n=1 Tax=Mycobacterium shottsii TaxID=133549 RepID=A0A7I7LBB4_9MYCO|nr:hypothetical protein [Mycobacterium shottsii]QYL27062.1 hypothetical protein TM48_01235 [Mycobacterium shottsii]BBX56729.1 hypothetical protein MSHO_20740 [Mycobacterium shottsii]
MTEPLCATLIERYLCTRGRRYFRGQHDGEFFFVTDAHPQRLHVHLEISPAHPEVFAIRVAPACFFPARDRALLARFADRWNTQRRGVTAIVHNSSDPQRIGVTAYKSQWIAGPVDFSEFAVLVDRAIGASIELFGELNRVAELPQTPPLMRDAG